MSAGIIALVTRSIPARTPPRRTPAVVRRTPRVRMIDAKPLAVKSPKKAPIASGVPVTVPVKVNQT